MSAVPPPWFLTVTVKVMMSPMAGFSGDQAMLGIIRSGGMMGTLMVSLLFSSVVSFIRFSSSAVTATA